MSERSEFTRQNAESSKLLVNAACGWFPSLCHQSDRRPLRTKQKPEVDSSVASLLQNDVQGAGKFFGLCLQNDKAAQGDSSGFSPQNDIKKDVILSQRRRIHLKQKHEVASSVASLLQNDVQGAWEFFGLCAQNDKAAQGDSSGIRLQNDVQGAGKFFGLRPQNDVQIKK